MGAMGTFERVYDGAELVTRRITPEHTDCARLYMILDVARGDRMYMPWDEAVEMAKRILKLEDDSTLKTYEGATSISSSTGLRVAEPPEYGGMM